MLNIHYIRLFFLVFLFILFFTLNFLYFIPISSFLFFGPFLLLFFFLLSPTPTTIFLFTFFCPFVVYLLIFHIHLSPNFSCLSFQYFSFITVWNPIDLYQVFPETNESGFLFLMIKIFSWCFFSLLVFCLAIIYEGFWTIRVWLWFIWWILIQRICNFGKL